jgi:lipoprotein-anchoring transpeptidase ErfK/SrfK
LVGPGAWVCSDAAVLSPEEPLLVDAEKRLTTGYPYPYYVVGPTGAVGYFDPAFANEASSGQELEKGRMMAILEERILERDRWGRNQQGRWFRMRELIPADTIAIHGQSLVGVEFDVAWVVSPSATMYSLEVGGRPKKSFARFDVVHVAPGPLGKSGMVQAWTSGDGPPASANDTERIGWIPAKDLAIHKPFEAPTEVNVDANDHWIDIELGSQTLVAYEGKTPVYATVISAGKGAPQSDAGTHVGVHRIWGKTVSTRMSNLEKGDAEHRYYLEDVPYAQFFDNSIALHGTYWHKNFGKPQSHGAVDLAPLDAQWLFYFTGPKLPRGWRAAFPSSYDTGTVVRVR